MRKPSRWAAWTQSACRAASKTVVVVHPPLPKNQGRLERQPYYNNTTPKVFFRVEFIISRYFVNLNTLGRFFDAQHREPSKTAEKVPVWSKPQAP